MPRPGPAPGTRPTPTLGPGPVQGEREVVTGMRWFGEPWPSADERAPVCLDDAARIDTPVGAPCLLCGELIDTDDRGVEIPNITLGADGAASVVRAYEHIECQTRSALGNLHHVLGRCTYL